MKKSYQAEEAVEAYRIVAFGTADGQVVYADAARDLAIGVTYELGADEEERVDVKLAGIVEVQLGGAVARGGPVTAGANGVGVAATPGARVIGHALEAGVAGDIVRVLLDISPSTDGANVVADPGSGVPLPVDRSASIAIVTAGAETNTLPIPTFRGQRLTLYVDTYVGNRVVTSAARVNQAGNTVLTFGAVGDAIILEAISIAGALRWQVAMNDGVALS